MFISKRLKTLIFVTSILCIAFFVSITSAFETGRPMEYETAPITSLAVIPFYLGQDPMDPVKTLSCPVNDLYYNKNEVTADAQKKLTGFVYDELLKLFDHRVLPLNTAQNECESLPLKTKTADIQSIAVETGRKLNVSHVVTGTVWRYRERVGGTMSVKSPASTAFRIYLIDVKNGEVFLHGAYDETQRPLTDNLFELGTFIHQGAKWLTVDELTRYGVNKFFKHIKIEKQARVTDN